MATGSEHYRKAEQLLRPGALDADGTPFTTDADRLAAAAAHAQLAQTAATMALSFTATAAANLYPTPAQDMWAAVMVPEPKPEPEPGAAVRRRYVEPGFTQAMVDEQARADEAF